ncbi:MAG: helix-turn-helix transcriptional regulator [Balneola sp.]
MSRLNIHFVLNEQDKADLKHYRKMYSETGDKFWKSAIQFFENGKKRVEAPEFRRAFNKAQSILLVPQKAGLNMREIAEHLDGVVSSNTVSQILRGESSFTISTLEKITEWQTKKLSEINNQLKAS